MIKRTIVVLLLISTTLIFGQSKQLFFEAGDFKLENGAVIRDCQIGYRTFGKLNDQKNNAILYPTWFCGTSEHLGNLVGPGKLVDSTKYFMIAVDALGNGISSSPSNSVLQPGQEFPRISIRDMVDSQYKLVTEKLGIHHLYGAIGGSMGSMQVFQWIVSYPDFIDKAVPYVSSPKMTSFDMYLFSIYLQIIESGRRSGQPEAEIMKTLRMLHTLMARTPQFVVKHTSPEGFAEFISSFDKTPQTVMTLDNWECQLHSMIAHDISATVGGDLRAAAKIVKAPLLIIVAETDHLVNPTYALEFADLTNAETLILKNDCGHLAVGCEMEKCAKTIEEFWNR